MLLKFVYFALFLLVLAGCGRTAPKAVSRSELLLDTILTISLYENDPHTMDGCFDLIREYELIFSRTHPDSELYALNAAGSMEVSEPLLEVLTLALSYCSYSEQGLDITMGGVSDLYAFSSDAPKVPSEEALAQALSHSGWEKIKVEGNVVTLTDPVAVLDLGAVAKGYIADRLADYLREQGHESAIINLGGNIYCLGAKPGGDPYKVGVQSPFGQRNETVATVEVTDKSVVTSGLYERSFELDGQFYHHILDPRTGKPVENSLAGVSIVSERSVDGDALSTLCFALGLDEGMALIEATDGVEALFITKDGQLHPSSGFVYSK